jgi:hypothetical protein
LQSSFGEFVAQSNFSKLFFLISWHFNSKSVLQKLKLSLLFTNFLSSIGTIIILKLIYHVLAGCLQVLNTFVLVINQNVNVFKATKGTLFVFISGKALWVVFVVAELVNERISN